MKFLLQSQRRYSLVFSALVLSIAFTLLPLRARAAGLTVSPSALDFGYVTIHQTQTLLVAVANTGASSVTISSMSTNNNKYVLSNWKMPLVLSPGESLELSVTFAPTAAGTQNGRITFETNSFNGAVVVGLSGSGTTSESVTATPANLAFGNVAVGQSSTLPVELTNTRGWTIVVQKLIITGGDFSVSGANFPLTLQGGQKVKLNATFKPQAQGETGGSFFAWGPGLDVPLVGTGTGGGTKGTLTITPATLAFGNVADNSTKTLTAKLSATSGSVTISSVSSSNSVFAVTGEKLPLTIPSGGNVSLEVAFTPEHSVTSAGKLSFTSNATDSPDSEALTGTGTAPYVDLSWRASGSPDVVGYNIYRSKSSRGGYSRLNSKLDADTYYTDATVAGDTTYYYATTAVNSSGKESSYSNQAKVVVP
jgi:hypothetical protein